MVVHVKLLKFQTRIQDQKSRIHGENVNNNHNHCNALNETHSLELSDDQYFKDSYQYFKDSDHDLPLAQSCDHYHGGCHVLI